VCTDENTIKVCQAARDFFYFKKGTWWVYKEQLTGATDSIWVSEDNVVVENGSNSAKRTCHCGWGKCQENIQVRFENKAHNKDSNENMYVYIIGTDLSDGITHVDEINGASEYLFVQLLRATFNEECHPISLNIDSRQNEKIDSINVLGVTYKEVIHSHYTSSSHSSDWLLEGWYAKNFHLVKFRDSKGTWELEKCNIVQ
jgi:hypothetical protein